MSFEASAEVYNEVMASTENSNATNFQEFLRRHPFKQCSKVCHELSTVVDIHGLIACPTCSLLYIYTALTTHSYSNFLHTFVDCEDLVKGGLHLLHRKTVVDAF